MAINIADTVNTGVGLIVSTKVAKATLRAVGGLTPKKKRSRRKKKRRRR